MPRPCRSTAMPCRKGFRMCLSHLIYTVQPCLFHTCHAVLCHGLEKNVMVRAWDGRGMASVNQTRPHCVNQMGKTHSKPIAARHAMCESALKATRFYCDGRTW